MNKLSKRETELMEENAFLKERIRELERSETERRRMEEELVVSKNRLSRAEIISRCGNWEFDLKSDRVFASEGARSIYGLLDREWTIPEVQKIPLPEYRGMLDEALSRLVNEDRPYNMEFKIRRPDTGEIKDMYAAAEYDRQKNVVFGVIQDVTARTRAEEALHESEQRYRAVFENTGAASLIMDDDTTINLCNAEFERVSGYTRDEIEGKKRWTEFVVPEDLDRMVAQHRLRRETSGQASQRYEFRFVSRTGEIRNMYIVIDIIHGTEKSVGSFIDITERKQAEEALRESERQFKDLSEKSVVGIYLVQDGVLRYVNSKFAQLLGYAIDEMIDKTPVEQIIFPEDWPTVEGNLRKRLSGELESLHYEFRVVRKNGQVRNAEIYSSITTYRGRPAVIGTLLDVTERKEAEQKIIESEQLLSGILAASPIGIGKVQDRNVVWVNETLCRFSGYTQEELQGRHTSRFYESREESERVGGLLYKEGVAEGRVVRKDGEVRNASIWISPTDSHSYIFTINDITREKEAEDALRKSEERYRNLFETVIDGVFIVNGRGRFLEVNKSACLQLGYSREELLQLSLSDTSTITKSALLKFRKEIKAERPLSFETSHRRKDGTILPVELVVTRVQHEGQRAFLGVARDITERERGERERNKLQEQLRQAQKMEAIGTLAGGVAHDFNNILTVITGYGSLLKMAIDGAEPLKAYVDQILSSSQKAVNLTRSLLAFSRKQPITLVPTSINGCIRGTEKLLKRLLTEDIDFSISLSPVDIIIMADATQIDQILINLATNARDAMKKGGKLTIETKAFEIDYGFSVFHDLGEPGRYALLSISDTGHGMDGPTREKVFDPFFTTKEPGKGTGLGLATAYGIVKQHNGYIDVISDPGRGTTFSVYLPAVEAAGEDRSVLSDAIKGGNETVLVAEDDASVRRLLKKILAGHGYTVLDAVDGQDAIDTFQKHKGIDLIILDSVMPRKNGRETYDAIRSMKPDVKALFMSGYTKDIVLDKGVEEGKVDFIAKPVSPDELLAKVREVMDRQGLR